MKCKGCGSATTVIETRAVAGGMATRRRLECNECGLRFNSFEVDDDMRLTLEKYCFEAHVRAVHKRWALAKRNRKIVALLEAGEKHAVIANEFGLSDNMISTIARRAGIPAYQKKRRDAPKPTAPTKRKRRRKTSNTRGTAEVVAVHSA